MVAYPTGKVLSDRKNAGSVAKLRVVLVKRYFNGKFYSEGKDE